MAHVRNPGRAPLSKHNPKVKIALSLNTDLNKSLGDEQWTQAKGDLFTMRESPKNAKSPFQNRRMTRGMSMIVSSKKQSLKENVPIPKMAKKKLTVPKVDGAKPPTRPGPSVLLSPLRVTKQTRAKQVTLVSDKLQGKAKDDNSTVSSQSHDPKAKSQKSATGAMATAAHASSTNKATAEPKPQDKASKSDTAAVTTPGSTRAKKNSSKTQDSATRSQKTQKSAVNTPSRASPALKRTLRSTARRPQPQPRVTTTKALQVSFDSSQDNQVKSFTETPKLAPKMKTSSAGKASSKKVAKSESFTMLKVKTSSNPNVSGTPVDAEVTQPEKTPHVTKRKSDDERTPSASVKKAKKTPVLSKKPQPPESPSDDSVVTFKTNDKADNTSGYTTKNTNSKKTPKSLKATPKVTKANENVQSPAVKATTGPRKTTKRAMEAEGRNTPVKAARVLGKAPNMTSTPVRTSSRKADAASVPPPVSEIRGVKTQTALADDTIDNDGSFCAENNGNVLSNSKVEKSAANDPSMSRQEEEIRTWLSYCTIL